MSQLLPSAHAATDRADGGTGIGVDIRRKETERFVQGAGRYVDDIQLPGMLYVSFVRSAVAHALVKKLDATVALSTPGVRAVLTGNELFLTMGTPGPRAVGAVFKPAESLAGLEPVPTDNSGRVTGLPRLPLASEKVRHVNEAIAAVVADSRYAAHDGACAVMVDYEPLPVVTDIEEAIKPGAPQLFDQYPNNIVDQLHLTSDDIEDVFAKADVVISERFETPRIAASPMEPRGVVASYEPGTDQLSMWCSATGVYAVRGHVARALSMHESKVRVISPDVGGSFGGKNGVYPEDVVLAYLARELKLPVKWIETRIEHLSLARHGRGQIHYIDVAVRSDGRVLAVKDRILADLGVTTGINHSMGAAFLYVTGSYDIQCVKLDAYGIATNKAGHGPVRGIGKADAAFVIERVMDTVARRLKLDPAEVRFKNFVPERAFPYRTATGAVLDSGRYEQALRRAMELANYAELRKQSGETVRPGVRRGVGVSLVIEPTGAGRRNWGGGYAGCRLRLEPSGTISAFPSISQQGQGHQTVISQIVADRLHISADLVDVVEGDTTTTPWGTDIGSSRSSAVLMPAAFVAGNLLKEKILRIAGYRLGVEPERLTMQAQVVSAEDGRSMSFSDVARVGYQNVDQLPPGVEPGMEVTGYFINPNLIYDRDEKGRRNEFSAYPYEAVVAAVDVDVNTGVMDIVKYVCVHDCGTVLNPRVVQTQHVGSVVQGLGIALFEEMRYDEDGQLMTSTFMDYLLPTVNEVPDFVLDHLVTPTPFTPLGAKGAGETGTLSPPAVLGNAIEDALASLGVKIRRPPYTPDRILALIKSAGVAASKPA